MEARGDMPLVGDHADGLLSEIMLPFAHPKVRLEDLNADGRLLSSDEVAKVFAFIEAKRHHGDQTAGKKPDRSKKSSHLAARYKKKDIGIQYGIIFFEDETFAIYRGVKQNCHLGSGGFGYAKLVQNIVTGEWAVLKCGAAIKDDDQEYLLLKRVDMGIGQLDRIAGHNSEFVRAQQRVHPSYYEMNQSNIVMKLAPGVPVSDLVAAQYSLSDVQLLQIIIQILIAYRQLESEKIIHGDLKMNNLFYDFVSNKVVIIDFGASAQKPWFRSGAKRNLILTEGYYAPELEHVQGKRKYLYTRETDIFALGMTIIYLLRDTEEDRSCSRITDLVMRHKILDYCRDVMCHPEPQKRLSVGQAIQFFENILKLQFNLLPKPFHKVGLLAVDEYRQLLADMEAAERESAIAPVKLSNHSSGVERLFKNITTGLANLIWGRLGESEVPTIQNNLPSPAQASLELAENRYDKFINILRQFDEIWFVDSELRTQRDYIDIRQRLEKRKVPVGSRCFVLNGLPVQAQIDAVQDKLCHEGSSKWNKYYFTTMRDHPINLNETQRATLQVMKISADMTTAEVNRLIDDYSLREIKCEYEYITAQLKSLGTNYKSGSAHGGLISVEILSAVVEIESCYKQRQLTYERLQGFLQHLKVRVRELEASSGLSSPRLQPSRHPRSLFGSKSFANSEACLALANLENHVQAWVKSYP